MRYSVMETHDFKCRITGITNIHMAMTMLNNAINIIILYEKVNCLADKIDMFNKNPNNNPLKVFSKALSLNTVP